MYVVSITLTFIHVPVFLLSNLLDGGRIEFFIWETRRDSLYL